MRILAFLIAVQFGLSARAQFVPEANRPAPIRRHADGQVIQVIQVPELITFRHLMSLSPAKRDRYLRRVAKALAEFETETNKTFYDSRYAEVETLRDRLALYLAIFPVALAQQDAVSNNSLSQIPNGSTVYIYNDGWEVRTPTGQSYFHAGEPPARFPKAVVNEVWTNRSSVSAASPPSSTLTPSQPAFVPSAGSGGSGATPTTTDVGGVTPGIPAFQAHPPGTGASLTPPSAGVTSGAESWEDAKNLARQNCRHISKRQLNQARTEYAADKAQANKCMIGGISSTYVGGKPEDGKCQGQRKWNDEGADLCDGSASASSSSRRSRSTASFDDGLTLCNPMLFCKQGKPICEKRAQDTAEQCFKAAGLDQLNEQGLENQLKDQNGCGQNVTKQDWDKLRNDTKNLCQASGAKTLFCVECTKLQYAIEAANKEAGPPPAARARPSSPSGSSSVVPEYVDPDMG